MELNEILAGGGWDDILKEEYSKAYFSGLTKFVDEEYSHYNVYPPKEKIFNALKLTPYESVKAVIIGQDPYHGSGQAEGLSFSVPKGCAIPPSLRNIHKELHADLGIIPPAHGSLLDWTRQGVLLLNAVLTVREGQASSHKDKGWETFTDNLIRKISAREKPLVFILWGSFAIGKAALIDSSRHSIIKSPHPSPFSADTGFFGSGPFSKANRILGCYDYIDWRIL